MVATALFSTRSWIDGAAFDRIEDGLHSLAATLMGFAFAAGVVATAVAARRRSLTRRFVVDAVAVTASVAVPLAMMAWPALDGALQRMMFAVAYLWYGSEALGARAVRR